MNDLVNDKLAELKLIKANRIENYASYRNRVSGHYGNDFVELLESFGKSDSRAFFNDVESMVKYSQGWLKILRALGKPDDD